MLRIRPGGTHKYMYAAAASCGRQATWWRKGGSSRAGRGGWGAGHLQQQRRGLVDSDPSGWGGEKKDHAMYYKPKALEFAPLKQWQYAAAAWNRSAPGYASGEMLAYTKLHEIILQKSLKIIDPYIGAHVLDVASAAGEPALSIARARFDATVVSTDYAATNTPIGRSRAYRAGVKMKFQFADAEELQFDDDAFDLVTMCQGLQYVDRAEAMPELYRVVKPEGGVIITVNGPVSDYHVPIMAAIDAVLGDANDDVEAVPNNMGTRPLLLAQPGLLTAELEELGFQDVSCETVEFPMEIRGNEDEAWERVKSSFVHQLNMLQEQGLIQQERDVEGEAKQAYLAALKDAGGIDCTGFRFPRNQVVLYQGFKPASPPQRGLFW